MAETKTISNVPVSTHLLETIKENTTKQQWLELVDTLEASLLRRMAATPDSDLARLKGKVEYIGELKNFFTEIFS